MKLGWSACQLVDLRSPSGPKRHTRARLRAPMSVSAPSPISNIATRSLILLVHMACLLP